MGLERLRERQVAKAKNRFWTPSEQDDFRVIVFRRIDLQPQTGGEPFEVLDGWEVESGAPFRMKVYGHLRWVLKEAGKWPPAPGAILSILYVGMGQTEQGLAYQFEVDEVDLAELDGLTQEQLLVVRNLQAKARAEAQAQEPEPGKAAAKGKEGKA